MHTWARLVLIPLILKYTSARFQSRPLKEPSFTKNKNALEKGRGIEGEISAFRVSYAKIPHELLDLRCTVVARICKHKYRVKLFGLRPSELQ